MQQSKVTRATKDMEHYFGGDSDVPEFGSDTGNTDIIKIECEGDPEVMLAILEKKAELAPRYKAAIDGILASQTFSEDWIEHGNKMCLTSAGAERIGRNFPIQYFEVRCRKEDFTDGIGKGYNYVFEGKASLGGHVVFAMGAYGTREAFLGKKDGEYRALEEINENSIRAAGYHIFCGSAIKSLLGIRGMPKSEWEALMKRVNRNPSKAGKVEHGKGTQGGTTQDDSAKQRELAEICMEIANAGKIIVTQDSKTFSFEDTLEISDTMEVATSNCITISGFAGDKGPVKGKLAKDLKGGWLNKALEKARDMKKCLEGQQ